MTVTEPLIRPIDLKYDSQPLIDLGRIAFSAQWSEEYLRWKYHSNPAGSFYGHCAEVNGIAAGFYSDIPVRMKINQRIGLGAQAVDGVVAPEQRRSGLFLEIATQNYSLMDQDEILLDYAFPNPSSYAGFTKRLSWIHVGDVPRFVKWVNFSIERPVKQALKRAAVYGLYRVISAFHMRNHHRYGDVRISTAGSFDERSDDLWQMVSTNIPIAVWRDAVYLNWRYVQNPCRHYIILIAERGSSLVGYAVLSLRDATSHDKAALVEFITAPEDEQAGLALLAETSWQARDAGCRQIQAWMLFQHHFYTRLLRSSGFVHDASRRLPKEFRFATPFIIRLRPGTCLEPDPTRLENWYLTAGDHDYY